MNKVVSVPAKVFDMAGLYFDLKASGFSIHNVAGSDLETHVHLDLSEEKDPSEKVLEWSKKELPKAKDLFSRARKQRAEAETARLKEEAMKAQAAEAETEEIEIVKEEGLEVDGRPSLLKRIFSKFF